MTNHTVHPTIREAGLADNCSRCSEHAQYPFRTLDDENLVALYHRLKYDPDSGRGRNEQKAMDKLGKNIRQGQVLAKALIRIHGGTKGGESYQIALQLNSR